MSAVEPTSLQKGLLGLLLLWALAVRVLFSWPDPTMNRLWDERYNAGNVAAILAHDQWRPVRTHYPTLSYLPHAATLKVYETARSLPWLSSLPTTFGIAPDGRPYLTRIAVRISRIIQTLVGTASLFVVFLIGRRLFGPWVALGAAFLLAVAPWHMRQSGVFKPDIMLVLTAVLTLYAILAARRSESLRGYALAGAMVGATAAAKWNGAALALPLLVAIALGGVRDLGLLVRRTAAAAAGGAVVLLLLNPWLVLAPEMYRRHLGSTVNHYRERLAEAGAGLFDQPLNAVTSLAGSVYFSPVLGACGLLGLGWMLLLALRARREIRGQLPGERSGATVADALVLAVFFGGYVASLWVVTRYPKPPNWLIVAPVVALAGAWFLGKLVRAARALPERRLTVVALAILAVVAGLAGLDKAGFVHASVYEENVPLTSAEAARTAGRPKPLRGRTFITELPLGIQDFDPRIWNGNYVSTLIRTDSIAAESGSEREAADILLFPASRLESGQDSVYQELTAEQPGAIVQRFDPGLFRLRGDPVVLVRRSFAALGPPATTAFSQAGEGLYDVDPAALHAEADAVEAAGTLVSLEIAVRTPSRDAVGISIEVDGTPLPCRHTQRGRERRRCLTPRFEVPQSPVRILVEPAREVIDVTTFRWRRPA
ncbi:MAG: glycosyltransferase family 39 protein [Holophagales bacterium]|nr:glycosyltransferase family 39 protein [Holophagales bacterium]MYD21704.1 glycosyltransferase family 39 protein [Holophagales bacterium]MYI32099.1 glycosyltransferase family 39 protein [Holophagales bacterium]